MKLFKNIFKNYLFFGIGTIFGSTIATIITYCILTICYGTPEMATVLNIQDCLKEKINE
tara:strand:- start:204 stop:380 length:177 start_codon:yes stop_codon:yes gene_type:complete